MTKFAQMLVRFPRASFGSFLHLWCVFFLFHFYELVVSCNINRNHYEMGLVTSIGICNQLWTALHICRFNQLTALDRKFLPILERFTYVHTGQYVVTERICKIVISVFFLCCGQILYSPGGEIGVQLSSHRVLVLLMVPIICVYITSTKIVKLFTFSLAGG